MNTRQQDIAGAIRDGILTTLVFGSALGAGLLAPNILQVLDKPMARYFKNMDKRAQDREVRRELYYLKRLGLIKTTGDDYEHGIKLTAKGHKRAKHIGIDNLKIQKPKTWDKKWRLVFFDIPEKHKTGRDCLTRKLKELGFYPLQRSVLVHPYPCRKEIARITAVYDINRYVSYIVTNHIDQEKVLTQKFFS